MALAIAVALTGPATATADPSPPPTTQPAGPADATRLALAHTLVTAAKLDDDVKSQVTETVGRPKAPTGEEIMADPRAMTKSMQLNESMTAGLDKAAPGIVDQAIPIVPEHMTDADMTAALAWFQGPAAKALTEAMNQASMAGLAGMLTKLPVMMEAAAKDYCGRVACTDADQRRFAMMKNLFGAGKPDADAPPAPIDPERLALAKALFAVTHEDAEMRAEIDRQAAESLPKLPDAGGGQAWTIRDSLGVAMKSMASGFIDDEIANFAKAAKPEDIQAALAFYRGPAGAAFLTAKDAVKAAIPRLTVQNLPAIYAAVEADYCAQMVCAPADHEKFKAMLEASRKAMAGGGK
jgi:hypothetical protein